MQTAATVLTMRYSRLTPPGHDSEVPLFATTSTVALAEFGKMWVGIVLLCYDEVFVKQRRDPLTAVSHQLFGDLRTLLKMAVPACTYCPHYAYRCIYALTHSVVDALNRYSVQNTLLFTALHHLDSSLYQITYQIKIFTAALFSMALLHRSYSFKQWISFGLLAVGAALSNLSMQSQTHSAATNAEDRNQSLGILCVLLATCTSGFAGK